MVELKFWKQTKCGFEKPDGQLCEAPAKKGSERCRHHGDIAVADSNETIGHIDHRLVEAEPGTVLSFYDDYSCDEIVNYVRNATGGRVEIPGHLSQERMATHAVEVLA